MDEGSNSASLRNEQSRSIGSLAFKKEDLLGICKILQERSHAAGDLEVENFKSRTDPKMPDRDALIAKIKECFNLNVLIKGDDGSNLWGRIDEVFSSVNFPKHVQSLHIDSRIPMQVGYNRRALNGFVIFLDFSKPRVLDFSMVPGNATPNGSNLTVDGANATWVNGVFHEISSIISSHPASFTIFHRQAVYDLLLFLLGLPFAFWWCFRLHGIFDVASGNSFVRDALYVYLFMGCLLVFRCLFHYVRWVFPRVDYVVVDKRAMAHKAVLGSLTLSLVGKLLYDLLREMF